MRPFFVLAALAIGACSSPTENKTPQVPLPVTGTQVSAPIDNLPSLAVVGGVGSITVTGSYVDGNGCVPQLVFAAVLKGDTVAFGYFPDYSGAQVCLLMPAAWTFQAVVGSIPPGTHPVRVETWNPFAGTAVLNRHWTVLMTTTVAVQ